MNTLIRTSWIESAAIHFILFAIGCFFLWPRSQNEVVDFEVLENPSPGNTRALQIEKPLQKIKETRPAVFGINRNTITDESDSSGIDAKKGNTVAKEEDNKRLRDDDLANLPIPADEYLVSSMPRLSKEYRIPYPPGAKKAGLQGPVIMDLLIDSAGKVRQVTLVSGPGGELNDAAVAAVKNFEFIPAKVETQSVAVKIRYSYRFVLEK